MLKNVLVREIKDPLKKEEHINPAEIKVYLELIKENKNKDNNNQFAEELFNQLIDKKESSFI